MLVLAAVAAGLVGAGCGGDDDDDESASTTGTTDGGQALSREAFITAADGVCAQGDQQIQKEAEKVFGQGQPSKKEQEDFVTSTVIPRTEAQIVGIRALTPPEGDEDEVTAILDSAEEGLDQAEQDPSTMIQGGRNNPLAEASQLAKQYGLKECGS